MKFLNVVFLGLLLSALINQIHAQDSEPAVSESEATITAGIKSAFSEDQLLSSYIEVRPEVKNIRMLPYPYRPIHGSVSLEYFVRSAEARHLAHEAAHVVQQRSGKLLIQLASRGLNRAAEILTLHILRKAGKTVVPFDASIFLRIVHFEVMSEHFPKAALLASEVARHRYIIQRNESDLQFLRARKSKCYEKKCDSDVIASIERQIRELESSTAHSMVQKNMQFLALQETIQKDSRKFQTLSNASKSRHDIALNSIRNMK